MAIYNFDGVKPVTMALNLIQGSTFHQVLAIDKSQLGGENLFQANLDFYRHERDSDIILSLNNNNGFLVVTSSPFEVELEIKVPPDDLEPVTSLLQDNVYFVLSAKIGSNWYAIAIGKAAIYKSPMGN